MTEPDMQHKAPLISVIIPVYNRTEYTRKAIEGIRNSTFTDYELILIDDCSNQQTSRLARDANADVYVRNETNVGPFMTRNIAATYARGKILVFTDNDVVFKPDTLTKIARFFKNDAHQCLIGLYTLEHPNKNFCSIYKNTWIRFSYFDTPETVNWFFTAIGAIRKSVWDTTKGFDTRKSNKTGSGDIEFGRALSEKGVPINLDKTLEVFHLRSFSLTALLRNDFCRAYGYARVHFYQQRSHISTAQKGYANINRSFIISTLVSGLIFICCILGVIYPPLFGVVPLFFLAQAMLNIRFLRYVAQHFSIARATACVPLLVLDTMACGFGILAAMIRCTFIPKNHNVS